MAAIPLMWACRITSCALRITLSTHSPTSKGWIAALTIGLWLVVPAKGIRSHASKPRMMRNTAT